MASNMVIDPVGSPAVPPVKPVETANSQAAPAPATLAKPSPGFPNPRIEFDPKLGVVVLEFLNPVTQEVTQYPSSATPAPAAPGHDITA
jgi:hypothetical protein